MSSDGSSSRADGGVRVGRHRARRNAMMVLYKLDVVPGSVEDAMRDFRAEHGFELPHYARVLVERVTASREELDELLGKYLQEWSVQRLGAVERSIMRIAACELSQGLVPQEISIDEAVELAKRYASPDAAKLVNGVLAGWLRAQEAPREGTE